MHVAEAPASFSSWYPVNWQSSMHNGGGGGGGGGGRAGRGNSGNAGIGGWGCNGGDPFQNSDPFAATPEKRKGAEEGGAVAKRGRAVGAAAGQHGGAPPQRAPVWDVWTGGGGGGGGAAGTADPFTLSADAFGDWGTPSPAPGSAAAAAARTAVPAPAAVGRTKRQFADVGAPAATPMTVTAFEDAPPVHRLRIEPDGAALTGPQKRKQHFGGVGARAGSDFGAHEPVTKFRVFRPDGSVEHLRQPPLLPGAGGPVAGPQAPNFACTDLIVHPQFGGGAVQRHRRLAYQLPRSIGPSGNAWEVPDDDDTGDGVHVYPVWETTSLGHQRPRRRGPLLLCDAGTVGLDGVVNQSDSSTSGGGGGEYAEATHGATPPPAAWFPVPSSATAAPRFGRAQADSSCGDVHVWGSRTEAGGDGGGGGVSRVPGWGVPVSPRERRQYFQAQQQRQQQAPGYQPLSFGAASGTAAPAPATSAAAAAADPFSQPVFGQPPRGRPAAARPQKRRAAAAMPAQALWAPPARVQRLQQVPPPQQQHDQQQPMAQQQLPPHQQAWWSAASSPGAASDDDVFGVD